MDVCEHYRTIHIDMHTGQKWESDVVDSGDDFIEDELTSEDDWLNHHADGAQSGGEDE